MHTQTHTQRQDIDKIAYLLGFVKKTRQKCKLSNKGKFFKFKNLKSSTTTLNFIVGYPFFLQKNWH
jgi:hypothetical protein